MKTNHETTQYLLHTAAEFIAKHAPESETQLSGDFFGTGDEPCTGRELADLLNQEGDDIAKESASAPSSLRITGTIIQAGGEKEPQLTISTTQRQLADCPSIPFFKKSHITITPLDP